MELQEWAKELGFHLEIGACQKYVLLKRLGTLQLQSFWNQILRSRPKYKWREYRKQIQRSELEIRRDQLRERVDQLKERLRQRNVSRPDGRHASLCNQISDIQTTTILAQEMIQQVKEMSNQLMDACSRLPSIPHAKEATPISEPTSVSWTLRDRDSYNKIVLDATKSHVQSAVQNAELEHQVLNLKERAFALLESMTPEERISWKTNACLKMIEYIETAKVPEEPLVATMPLELEFTENNQCLLQKIDKLLNLIVKLNASQKSIIRLVNDATQTHRFIKELQLKIGKVSQALQSCSEELFNLLMNVDVMRMYENSSLVDWRWKHDPSLSRVKMELGLPASVSYSQFTELVENMKEVGSDLKQLEHTAQESLEQLDSLLNESLRRKENVKSICNSLDEVNSISLEYTNNILPRLEGLSENYKICLKTHDEIKGLIDAHRWYVQTIQKMTDSEPITINK
jgi:uncharacterized coiled-coil DUF342 family protein